MSHFFMREESGVTGENPQGQILKPHTMIVEGGGVIGN